MRGYGCSRNVLLGGGEVAGGWRKSDFNQQNETHPGGSTEYIQIPVSQLLYVQCHAILTDMKDDFMFRLKLTIIKFLQIFLISSTLNI